ncbi:MAG TPA: low affinity iron permease family protein [Dehalococcoidia bacterium]|nr:low affinity iron permease family protein [Dehalococcoidia bacterium]
MASAAARALGSQYAFLIAGTVILCWIISGPIFGFSDTWQLVINTATTIITFLAVFLIQNTQNRDSTALQIKLDEIIRAIQGAQNTVLDLEELDEGELDKVREEYKELAREARDVADVAEKAERQQKTGRRRRAAGAAKS